MKIDASQVGMWKRTIAVNNKAIDAYYKLGKYYLQENNLGPAKECFDHVLQINKELSTGWAPKRLEDTYICLSIIAEKRGDFGEALNRLNQLIKMAPKSEYFIVVAELLMKLKRYEQALELLNKASDKTTDTELQTKAKRMVVKIMTIQGSL